MCPGRPGDPGWGWSREALWWAVSFPLGRQETLQHQTVEDLHWLLQLPAHRCHRGREDLLLPWRWAQLWACECLGRMSLPGWAPLGTLGQKRQLEDVFPVTRNSSSWNPGMGRTSTKSPCTAALGCTHCCVVASPSCMEFACPLSPGLPWWLRW